MGEESPHSEGDRDATEEYSAGQRTEFDLRMELDGNAFQKDVWPSCPGSLTATTISYGEPARRVGRPKGPRAVGQANRRNPIAITVPATASWPATASVATAAGPRASGRCSALEGVSA